MPGDAVFCDKKEHIAWITLNRPSAGNIIDLEMANDLSDACRRINQDDSLRVAIVTGAGEVFCAGADIGDFFSLDRNQTRTQNASNLASRAIASLNCPVIAAINGDALSAGLELALACDIRIACDSARLGFPETAYGLIPGGGGTQRLPRLIGRGKATEMILTAEPVNAEEAYRIGLVTRIVPKQRVAAEAEEIAGRLVSRAPIAVRYAKEAVYKGMDMTLEQGLRLEADLSFLLQTTEDRAEGIQAFLDKRKANFKGE